MSKIKKVIEDNITVYQVEDDGVIQEFGTYKEAEEFVSYIENPKAYMNKVVSKINLLDPGIWIKEN